MMLTRKRIVTTMGITAIIAIIIMMNMRTEEIHNPIVRPATQANRFYEGNPQQLSHEVDSF